MENFKEKREVVFAKLSTMFSYYVDKDGSFGVTDKKPLLIAEICATAKKVEKASTEPEGALAVVGRGLQGILTEEMRDDLYNLFNASVKSWKEAKDYIHSMGEVYSPVVTDKDNAAKAKTFADKVSSRDAAAKECIEIAKAIF